MVKKYDFIDRTIYLIRKILEENLSNELTLEEMITERDKILKRIINGGKE